MYLNTFIMKSKNVIKIKLKKKNNESCKFGSSANGLCLKVETWYRSAKLIITNFYATFQHINCSRTPHIINRFFFGFSTFF